MVGEEGGGEERRLGKWVVRGYTCHTPKVQGNTHKFPNKERGEEDTHIKNTNPFSFSFHCLFTVGQGLKGMVGRHVQQIHPAWE